MAEDTQVVIGGRYLCGFQIGKGSFGQVYGGIDLETKEPVAIKRESLYLWHRHLYHEYTVYTAISGGTGIPKVRWYGTETDYNILVMDILGQSLEALFSLCGEKFSLKTVLMLADQLIERIEHIHAGGFLYRDLKPENIVMGIGQTVPVVHIIDFGLAKCFRDPKTLSHIPQTENNGLVGTVLFASVNCHNGVEQSRRDDMESLGYLLMYFLRGNLPWEDEMPEEMVLKKTASESLCESHPKEFVSYIHYCRSLGFEDTPDYAYLRGLFRDLFVSKGFQWDNEFDWTPLLEKERKAKATTAPPAVVQISW